MAYILIFFLSFSSLASDVYVIDPDIIKARDKALKSLDEAHRFLWNRYQELLEKENLTLAEMREFEAINKIIRFKVYGEELKP